MLSGLRVPVLEHRCRPTLSAYVMRRRSFRMTGSTLNPSEFTSGQKKYLESFFSDVARLVPFVGHTGDGLITADPASGLANMGETEAIWFDTPLSDLSREERWKFEQDPFAIWD